MAVRTPNITTFTSDYDAIERAIRETTRGRWFLNCYLERNRSTETRMLLDAIARLEGAMRDNGHVVAAMQPAETLSKVAEAIGDARAHIAHMVTTDGRAMSLAVPRFSFGSISRSAAASAQAIRDAAVVVAGAARALHEAGVFQGIAKQITEKSAEILRACTVQDASIRQMERLAEALSEVEAEVMAIADDQTAGAGASPGAALHAIRHLCDANSLTISDDVMKELSVALAGSAALADSVTPTEPA